MIRLEEINGKIIWDILKLRVSDAQKSFVASNDISIIEAYIAITHHGQAFPFGIYEDETPVGFCMIGFGADDDWEDAPDIARNNYNLWRLMIDKRYQGKGYGRAAMKQIMDYIASEPCGPAEYCWLSYEPENTRARDIYRKYGFVENGEIDKVESRGKNAQVYNYICANVKKWLSSKCAIIQTITNQVNALAVWAQIHN